MQTKLIFSLLYLPRLSQLWTLSLLVLFPLPSHLIAPSPHPVLSLACRLCLLSSTLILGRAEVSSCTSKPVSSTWAQSLTSFWASLEVACVTMRPSSDDSDICKLQGQGKKYWDLIAALSFCQLNTGNEDKAVGNSGATRQKEPWVFKSLGGGKCHANQGHFPWVVGWVE